MKTKTARLSGFAAALGFCLLLGGCTKEKAEAIKNAAEQFCAQATAALSEIRELYRHSLSLPVESQEKLVAGFAKDFDQTTPFGAKELSFVLKDPAINAPALRRGDEEFAKLEAHYSEFAAMFRSLPQGSFLAAKSVKKAEKHAINLTLELINLANYAEKNPVQFTARRVQLLENIGKDKAVTNLSQRAVLLQRDAEAAFQLQQDELQAKQRAIVACLKAAETCRTVAEMIRDYDKLSASDILNITRDTLSFAAEVSGGNPNVTELLNKFNGVETSVRSDPYWSALLDKTLNP